MTEIAKSRHVRGSTIKLAFLLPALICLSFSVCLQAQEKKKETVELRGLTGKSVGAPKFSVTVRADRPSAELADEFIELRSEFLNRAEWVDELTFTYYLLMESSDAEDTKGQRYNLFKGEVTYEDIKKAPRLASTMYLSPSKTERYGKPKSMRVEVTYQGRAVAELTRPETKTPWWSAAEPVGRLLKRSETPFALIDSTYYLDIKDDAASR